MKKITALIIGILISTLIIHAQPPEFTILLGENMPFAVDMIQSTKGDFIIVGNSNSGYSFTVGISKEGEILWNNIHDGDMLWYSSFTQKSNGNILIPMGNYNPTLLELSESGDSLGCTIISEQKNSYFGSVIEMSDNSIIATELIYTYPQAVDSIYLIKISQQGNVTNKIPLQYNHIKQIFPDNNEILAVVSPDAIASSLIVKYNDEGQEISNSYCALLEPYLYTINKIKNGKYISCGYIDGKSMQGTISMFNNVGEIEFCKEYSSYSYFMSATSNPSTETVYLLGQKDDSCTITALDFYGNIISEYNVADSLYGQDIIFSDNYLYVAGIYNYLTSPRSCFIKISKNSVLSIDERYSFPEIKTYPNPAKDYVIFELPVYTNNSIVIFDIYGKEIIKLPITSEKTVWGTREVKDGIYFYSLEIEGKVFNGKIIIN